MAAVRSQSYSSLDFSSDDVFVTGMSIGFGFSAVDGDLSLLTIESLEGAPLLSGTYDMGKGALEGLECFAGSSVVRYIDADNVVFEARGGGITLETQYPPSPRVRSASTQLPTTNKAAC